MACYKPLQAYYGRFLTKKGLRSVVFSVDAADFPLEPLRLPCGRCVGCRLEYSRQWAIRCMHEAELHDNGLNCAFVTLTYSDACLPDYGSLDYSHFVNFMKRFRKALVKPIYDSLRDKFGKRFASRFYWRYAYRYGPKVRYFMGAEYGEDNFRPHYHVLIFGFNFPDKYHAFTHHGHRLYRSPFLESLWTFGFSSVGAVTFKSAAYVARYMLKKVKGDDPFGRYFRPVFDVDGSFFGEIVSVEPEKALMSRRPGIASDWFKRFKDDVYPHDYVVINGCKSRPPKYYDNLYRTLSEDDYAIIRKSRTEFFSHLSYNSTPDRLKVREQILTHKLGRLSRVL